MKKKLPAPRPEKKPRPPVLPARKDSPEPSIRFLDYYVPGYIG